MEFSEAKLEDLSGRQMAVGRAVQNVQFEMRAKGTPLGSVSAKNILEMVDRGEIDESPSISALRELISG